MNAPQEAFTLELSRHIRAPRERVFQAFVDESLLAAWHCPRGMKVMAASVDARVDGAWRLEMQARDGSRMAVGGRYREVQRPARLVYSWQWQGDNPMAAMQTLIEVDFTAERDGTTVRMRHSGFPSAAVRDSHDYGWSSCFNRLNDLLDERGSAATVTLLGDPRSPYVRAVRLGLAEKGVAYTLQPVAPHSAEIDAIHPFGRIPALRDGAIEWWESSAILRYVEESFDGPSLLPANVRDRTRCEQWVSAVNCHLYDTMARRYVLQYVIPRGENGQPDRGVIDQALAEMPRQLAALERAYGGRDFLAGPTPSLADFFVTPLIAYLQAFPESARLLSDMPHIRHGLDAMRARPSFTATEPAITPKEDT